MNDLSSTDFESSVVSSSVHKHRVEVFCFHRRSVFMLNLEMIHFACFRRILPMTVFSPIFSKAFISSWDILETRAVKTLLHASIER